MSNFAQSASSFDFGQSPLLSNRSILGPNATPGRTGSINNIAPTPVLKPVDAAERYTCDVCAESILPSQTVGLCCAHKWCHSCIAGMFKRALKDDATFPARCCREEIPTSLVRYVLGRELVHRTEDKAVELATMDRTYCSRYAPRPASLRFPWSLRFFPFLVLIIGLRVLPSPIQDLLAETRPDAPNAYRSLALSASAKLTEQGVVRKTTVES